MDPISDFQPNVPGSVIDKYKAYFKSINLEQSGTEILLGALNDNKPADDMFQSGAQNDWIGDFFSQQAASTVHINKDAVQKNLWADLEKEIKYYESKHPDIKGKYLVAVSPDGGDGLPTFKVADKRQVLGMINQNDQAESDSLITDHPVQVFKSDTLHVASLKDAGIPGIEQVVAKFFEKNKGVFQFFNNPPSEAL